MKKYSTNRRTPLFYTPLLPTPLRFIELLNRFSCQLVVAAILILASSNTLAKHTLSMSGPRPRYDIITYTFFLSSDYRLPTPLLDTLNNLYSGQQILAPCSNQDDYAALEALFNATNGSAWNNKINWLTDRNPCGWYGVSCLDGRVDGINLSYNHLVGSLPTSLSLLTQLRNLYVDGNQLSGPIPSSLTSLTRLEVLSGNFNQLTGSIPATIGNLTQLQGLYLSNNQLTGSIPASLTALIKLSELNLSTNRLSGYLPTSLGILTNLKNINLTTNQLSGPLPASLVSLTQLEYLNLGHNQLTGSLSTNLCGITQLRGLYLSGNHLSGPLPSSLSMLSNLLELYLGDNQFTGPIPANLGSLTKLIALDLGYNQLSGDIPSSLGALVGINTLDVSHNQLSGCFPSSLSALCGSWRTINFSANSGLPNQGNYFRFCDNGNGGCYRLPDLIPVLTVRPTIIYNTTPFTIVVEVAELNSVATSGTLKLKVTKDANLIISFPANAKLINNQLVHNSVWSFDETDPDYYLLQTSQPIEAGNKLSFGLTGRLKPGATGSVVTISTVILSNSIAEASQNNNSDTEKIELFQP